MKIMDEIKFLFANTPWWVYLLFLYCLLIGYLGHRTRIILVHRVFIVPVLIAIWAMHGIFVRHALNLPYFTTWFASLVLGCLAGAEMNRHIRVIADKRHMLIQVPGTWKVLILVLIIFALRYYFGYYHVFDPATLYDPFLIYSDLILMGFFIGLIMGRSLRLLIAYHRAPHKDLQSRRHH